MKKVLWFILLFLFIPIDCFAIELPSIHSEKLVIYDLDNDEVIFNKNGDEVSSIASLTKVMTTIVAIENINDLDEEVVITSEMLALVRWDASIAGLKVGDKVTYRDLLYASILPSGADATNSLALLISGSVDGFVKLMNDKAIELGMNNTKFYNVTGLDHEEHYSSVDDLLKLLTYSLNNEVFKEIYTTKEYKLSNGLLVKSTVIKSSNLIGVDHGRILGSKTGFTLDAGLCISAIFKSNEHNLLLITLGAPYSNDYYNIVDALTLIDFMDNSYKDELIFKKDTFIKDIIVKDSTISNYNIYLKNDVYKYLPKDYNKDDLKIVYEGLEEIDYKQKLNSKLGTIKCFYKDMLVYQEDVILDIEMKISTALIMIYVIIILIVIIFLYKIIFRCKKRKNYRKR